MSLIDRRRRHCWTAFVLAAGCRCGTIPAARSVRCFRQSIWLEPILRKVIETRQPILNAEYRGSIPGIKGTETIWLVSYFPLEDETGNVAGLNGVVPEISGQVRQRLYCRRAGQSVFRLERQARMKLDRLEAAAAKADLVALPGNRVEALKGNRKGHFSIRINDRWRTCFEWPDGQKGPSGVEIVDYQ